MSDKVVVIGAGVGGLSAAISLAAGGHDVTVLERQAGAGGKMLPVVFKGQPYDAGPTVLTMKWVFEELFARAGADLSEYLTLEPLSILARHFWSGGETLDLFADQDHSTSAIGAFAGQSAVEGYQRFLQDSTRIYNTLRDTFLTQQRPTLLGLSRALPFRDLLFINPLENLWHALGRYFPDPRLRQLFGRYATYCGTSPFKAPATLMLIAAVEEQGVWQVNGGMHALPVAMEKLAHRLGVKFAFNKTANMIETTRGDVDAVIDDEGVRYRCNTIVLNADHQAAAIGLFGKDIQSAFQRLPDKSRSLSAITWCLSAQAEGKELDHHNVFFSDDYASEFKALEQESEFESTVYLCHQGDGRMLLLINTAANGQCAPQKIEDAVIKRLSRCGVDINLSARDAVRRDARSFAELYPATQGALYGRATNGWTASFSRPQARTAIPGLYLAGGSIHPGPGVPMAVLSGMRAAEAVIADRASTRAFRKMATAGGTLMH